MTPGIAPPRPAAGWRAFDSRAEAGLGVSLWLRDSQSGKTELATCEDGERWTADASYDVFASGMSPDLCHDVLRPSEPVPGLPEPVRLALRAVSGLAAVAPVPAGFAVSLPFELRDGDRLSLYLTGPDADGGWTLTDDGGRVPFLEAQGCGPSDRPGAFRRLLSAHGVRFEAKEMGLAFGPVPVESLDVAVSGLVAAILGLDAFSLIEADSR